MLKKGRQHLLVGPPPQVLAIGDAGGVLSLREMPRSLRRRGHAEVKVVAALLQRERERLERVTALAAARAAAQREAEAAQRAAEAQAAAGGAGGAGAGAPGGKGRPHTAVAHGEEQEGSEEDAAETRYRALEAQWRAKLGLEAEGVAAA